MLSPKELYYFYTVEPCEFVTVPDLLYNPPGYIGQGTPYDIQKLNNFLKQVKYPCYYRAPHAAKGPENETPGILGTGKNKLCLSFKFLQRLDVEAFSEIQPDIHSGTSHAIRNACDIMRACDLEKSKKYTDWEARGATEHIQYFGDNNITDCLMVLGPDLVKTDTALNNRWSGCGDMDCLPGWKTDRSKSSEGSALGSDGFSCQAKSKGNPNSGEICTPCGECPDDDPDHPCCVAETCEDKMKMCCGDIVGERDSMYRVGMGRKISYEIINDGVSVLTIDDEHPLTHIGILKRKSYGGYVNLLNNSGNTFYGCPPDLLLKYFQKINGYNYADHSASDPENDLYNIQRVRTISLIKFSDTSETMSAIKDLLYNGHGVVIMTNVGFPNSRDSIGISYPDRIWYHSYAIIGYDDRKVDSNECLFLLANSWGKWNNGGHPSWGPIPDGSFLVTESHLGCMLKLLRTDQKGCRGIKPLTPEDEEIKGCVSSEIGDTACSPWNCDKKQKALGMAFALSLYDGFPPNNLDFGQFYKVRENTYEPDLTMYHDGSSDEATDEPTNEL